MKWVVRIVIVVVVVGVAVMSWLVFTGPRMKNQPHIQPYQAVMPPMPEGVVPVKASDWPAPTTRAATELSCPIPATPVNVARGKTYYEYYCVFCHGDDGKGNGPVGRSYVPTPAALTPGRIADYGDGELLRRMLTGDGHEPVLERVVQPEHRWYVVLYVRQLAGQQTTTRPSTPAGGPR